MSTQKDMDAISYEAKTLPDLTAIMGTSANSPRTTNSPFQKPKGFAIKNGKVINFYGMDGFLSS
jgi:hypothetical protein